MSRRPWIVKVPVPKTLPASKANQYMKEVAKRLGEWRKNGPDPLVIPSDWEVIDPYQQWEHMVHELLSLHPDDLTRLLEDHQREGWQVAGCVDRSGSVPLLIFKRPKPFEGEPEVKYG